MRRAGLLLLVATAVLSTGAATPDGGASTGQTAFEAALAREAQGDWAGAAAALEALAREAPDDAFTDDALFEAAVVSEEHLGDPARAERLYQEVVRRFPTSRLARRARTRAEFLQRSLATGAAPLVEYQEILNQLPQRGRAESVRRMRALLDAHPDFALADRALFWIATLAAEAGDRAAAEPPLLELERRFPDSELAPRAKKLRADLLLGARHPFAARALYRQLAGAGDPTVRAGAAEGLRAVQRLFVRTALLAACALYLALWLALQLRTFLRLRRTVTPPAGLPTELWYYLPIAGLFVAAAVTENRLIGVATAILAVGGALLVWAIGAVTPLVVAARPLSRGARLRRATATALAALAVAYVAVQATGLTDLVLETLRAGPER